MRISVKRYAMLNVYEERSGTDIIPSRVLEFQITPRIASGHGMCLGYVRPSRGRYLPVVVVLTSLFIHNDQRQTYDFDNMNVATHFLVQRVTDAMANPQVYFNVLAVADELYTIMRRREGRAAEFAS